MTPELRAAQDRIEWLERDLAATREALQDCADIAMGYCGPMSNVDALEKIGRRTHAALAEADA